MLILFNKYNYLIIRDYIETSALIERTSHKNFQQINDCFNIKQHSLLCDHIFDKIKKKYERKIWPATIISLGIHSAPHHVLGTQRPEIARLSD